MEPYSRFPGIVIDPDRLNGQPTFAGRRVAVMTIAGMVAAGEPSVELAAAYRLSLAQVQTATDFAAAHNFGAA